MKRLLSFCVRFSLALLASSCSTAVRTDYNKDIAVRTKAIELNPNDAVAYRQRGEAKRWIGDINGAIADETKAIELNPDDAKAYGRRALVKKIKGDLGGAIADYNKAIELNPKTVSYWGRGEAYQAKGDQYEANADYNMMHNLSAPNIAGGFAPIATADIPAYVAYFMQKGRDRIPRDLDGAIAEFNMAIEVKPDYADAYNGRGVARGMKGDLDGAISDYNKAIELNPNLAVAFNNRGYAKKAKGDLDGANSDFAKALQIEKVNK